MTSVRPALFGPPPVLVGHRGAPSRARENTPASFAAAVGAGATWVELDARLDGDGTVVVHHDPVLPDGRPVVELSTTARLAADVWSLADVLAALAPGIGVDLEIKNFPGEPDHDESMAIVDACARVVAKADARPLVVTSFNPLVLMDADAQGWSVARGLLTMGLDLHGGVEAAVELGCAALCPHHSTGGLDARGVEIAHDAGLALLVWTVDDPQRAAALVVDGVDAICTNDPDVVGRAIAGPPSS